MVEVQKWEHPPVAAWKEASLWHYWRYSCLIMMSVSSCVGVWGGERCWGGENMSPFTSSAWVSLTATLLFLLITPPTNLWHLTHKECVSRASTGWGLVPPWISKEQWWWTDWTEASLSIKFFVPRKVWLLIILLLWRRKGSGFMMKTLQE